MDSDKLDLYVELVGNGSKYFNKFCNEIDSCEAEADINSPAFNELLGAEQKSLGKELTPDEKDKLFETHLRNLRAKEIDIFDRYTLRLDMDDKDLSDFLCVPITTVKEFFDGKEIESRELFKTAMSLAIHVQILVSNLSRIRSFVYLQDAEL